MSALTFCRQQSQEGGRFSTTRTALLCVSLFPPPFFFFLFQCMSHFDLTMTHARSSDVPLTYVGGTTTDRYFNSPKATFEVCKAFLPYEFCSHLPSSLSPFFYSLPPPVTASMPLPPPYPSSLRLPPPPPPVPPCRLSFFPLSTSSLSSASLRSSPFLFPLPYPAPSQPPLPFVFPLSLLLPSSITPLIALPIITALFGHRGFARPTL